MHQVHRRIAETWSKFSKEERKQYEERSLESKKDFDRNMDQLQSNGRGRALPAGAPKRNQTSYFIFLQECRMRLKLMGETKDFKWGKQTMENPEEPKQFIDVWEEFRGLCKVNMIGQ